MADSSHARKQLNWASEVEFEDLVSMMVEADYKMVLERAAIERDGKLWAWGIPVILPVTDAEAMGRCSRVILERSLRLASMSGSP